MRPTRLVAAQQGASGFIEQLPAKFRVGIVTFASTAQTLTSPTTDRRAIYQAIASLHAEGATAMGDGIERALNVKRPPATVTTLPGARAAPMAPQAPTGKRPPLVVLLLSDGANSYGHTEPLQAAADAKQLGVPVFTIALGTDDGTVDVPSQSGQTRRVPVPPDRATLQRIAETTGGRFLAAPSSRDRKGVYDELGSKIGFVKQKQEVTVVFAAGLLLPVADAAVSLAWFNRLP